MGEHDVHHGAGYIAIAFEFDDDQIGVGLLFAVQHIIPLQVHIDGQPFGFGLVDQCDAPELGPEVRTDVRPAVPALGVNEGLDGDRFVIFSLVLQHAWCIGCDVKARHNDAFLVGASLVVFALDFEEGQVAIDILSDAYLLPHELSVVVAKVHIERVGVVIHGVVGSDAFAVDLLGVIIRLSRL